MPDAACQESTDDAPGDAPLARAKQLILKTLGVRRVASWCGVGEMAVYQWLQRGSDAEPIPPARVAAIVAGAKAEGLEAPIGVLWPAMAEAQQ